MKTISVLTLLQLIAILIFGSSSLGANQEYFHSEANGCSLAIPDGWAKVPDNIVQKTFAAVLTEEFRRTHKFEAILAMNFSKENFIQYPYLVIQVIRYSDFGINRPLKKNEFAYFLEVCIGLEVDGVDIKEAVENHISNDFKGAISEIAINKASFDEQNMTYKFRMQSEIATIGKVKGLAIGHIGRYGIVQLMFYSHESDWSRFENERNLMFNSFRFDPGMRYEDAPGKWSDTDILIGMTNNSWPEALPPHRLGEAVAKGLRYALIAGFLGLIIGLFGLVKRLFGPKKKSTNEGILKEQDNPEDIKK